MISTLTQHSEKTSLTGAPTTVLAEIARRYGTPAYAYDVDRIRAQADKLGTQLPAEVEVLYSLKANPSLGVCAVLADAGLGVDVASAGELATALEAGFAPSRIFLTGPDRSAPVLKRLAELPEITVSVDSVSELRLLASSGLRQRMLLRLRPDFCSFATCSTGPDSRFGLIWDDLKECRAFLSSSALKVVGFHVFSGSQVLSAEGVMHHLRGGLDLSLRAADVLGMNPDIIDIGGGFGIPYAPGEAEMDLAFVGAELRTLVKRASPARLALELGRYLIAQAGWYLTTVLAHQTRHGRPAVVVDGGTHQRGDMCGLGLKIKALPPLVLSPHAAADASLVPTDILGCLSLPGDVLGEARPLPPLTPGDVLAFPNAGAYGLGASPWAFHGHPAPAEIAFEGTSMQPIRIRQRPESVLDGQTRFRATR